MKLPFGWRNGSSRCGESSVQSSSMHKHMNDKRRGTNAASKGRRDTEDSGTTSPVTSMATPPSSCKEIESKPVDMDQYCEAEENACEAKCTIETPHGDLQTNTSNEAEAPYSSALTKAMDLKQTKISKSMEKLFDDIFQVMGTSDQSSELKEKAAIYLKKQELITKQYVDVLQRLEQEALKKEAVNQRLLKRLRTANHLLEAEGISMVSTPAVPTMSLASRRGTRTEMFAITEIFCNEPKDEENIDDMTCNFSEAADVSSDKVKEPPLSPVTAKTVTSTSDPMQLNSGKELLEF